MREIIEFIGEHREEENNFNVACIGKTSADDIEKRKETIREFAEVGITWWMEDVDLETKEEVLKTIQAGPPKI